MSFQRAITKDMAVDVRYVGTRGVNQWSELNYNERNLIENNFFNEFRLAMANLQANNASGATSRVGSFAYFGPGTGTNPLPIYLAYLNGRTNATDPTAYTGGSNTWTNTTLAGRLVRVNPNPQSAAGDLDGELSRRQLAAQAGLPANFRRPHEAVRHPRLDELRAEGRGAERPQQHQLHHYGQCADGRHGRGDLPDQCGLHGREQYVRSRRARGAVDVPVDLVM